MDSTTFQYNTHSRRRGMALLFVLGSLAVMVIAVVSFGAFMRVERLVAANSVEISKAQLAALSGLDRALTDIRIRNSYWPAYPPTFNGQRVLFAGRNLAATPPLPSFPSGNIGRSGLTSFMPMNQTDISLWDDTLNMGGGGAYDITNSVGQVTGRARVAVCNAGGRVDIGALLSTPNPYQAGGMNVGGLAPPTQSQIADISRDQNMIDYFTMPEVRYLGFVGNKLDNVAKESNFTFLEMFSQKYQSPNLGAFTNSVYVGAGLTELLIADPAYQLNLADALFAAGLPLDAAASATLNLVDYLDSDFRPQDPNKFCGEPVPLINEINLQSIRTETSSNVLTRCTVRVEINYPFKGSIPPIPPQANNSDYVLRATITSPDGTSSHTPTDVTIVKPSGNSSPWTYPVDEHTVVILASDVDIISPAGTGAVRVQITLEMLEKGTGFVIDRVGTAADPVQFSPSVTGYNWSREVRDGRFNYLATEWATTVQNGTLGARNTTVATSPVALSEYPYYVRNAPMISAAELGNVALGNMPWQSIALVEDHTLLTPGTVHQVLDTFTVHLGLNNDGSPFTAGELSRVKGRAGPLVRGLINANTDMPNALSTVFYNGSNAAEAIALATSIYNVRRAPSRNFFTRKSDLGATFDSWGSPALSETDKETVLRTFVDLCDVRGNTFVILVQGIAVLSNNNTGIAEIAAHVWRCPLTNRIIVRHVKWVDRDDDLLVAY